MNEKQMTQQESLAIITKMIAMTQRKMEQSGGGQLLLWGYLSLFTTGIITLTGVLGWRANGWLWLLIPIVGLPLSWLLDRKYPQEVSSWRDEILSKIWLVFTCIFCLVPIVLLLVRQPQQIFFIEMLLMTTGVILTGTILRLNSLIVGGVIGLAIACVSCLITVNWQYMILTLSLIFIFALIIPGHIIYAKRNHHA